MSDSVPMAAAETFSVRDLLNIRNYRYLWLGQIISDFGDSLTNLALLMLVNKLTGSTAALATMAIMLTLPQLLFGLLAGVYVDRLDRKRIMLLSDLLRGALVLGFAVVTSADQVWILYVIGFVQGAIGTFFTPARSAIIPNLVPTPALLAANSLSQTSRIIAGLLGTAAAGVLIGGLGVYWPAFGLDALTFFVSFALISQIRVPVSLEKTATRATQAVLHQLGDGLRLILHTRILLGTLVAGGVTMLGLGATNVLMVPFMLNDLRIPAAWFGLVEGVQTVSMVVSGALLAVLASRVKPTMMVALGLVALGVSIGLLAGVGQLVGLLLVIFLVGWTVTPIQAAIGTLVQTSVPDEVRGRSGAALSTLISLANLTSMALAGVLAATVGVRVVFILSGAVVVLAGLASAWVFRTATLVTGVQELETVS